MNPAQTRSANPCLLSENEQIAAKIWELLRRNEAFRADVLQLSQLDAAEGAHNASTGEYHGPAWHKSCQFIDHIAERHPFAGIALRWLIPEPLFHVQRVTYPLGTKWRKRLTFSPRELEIGEGTTPDISDDAHWRWWKNSSQGNHAGRRQTRGPDVYLTTSRVKRLCDKVNAIREWQQFHWPFTVDHAWDKAPLQFRRQFQFVWRNQYDCRPKNPISNRRSDSSVPHESDFFAGWHLQEFRASGNRNLSRDDLAKLIRFDELADDYRIFAIPKTILTKGTADLMGKWLSDELKKGHPFYGNLVKERLLNEGEMFGTTTEWGEWLSGAAGQGASVPKDTHFYRRRGYMNSLVQLIYPNFQIDKLLSAPTHRSRGKIYVRKGRQK